MSNFNRRLSHRLLWQNARLRQRTASLENALKLTAEELVCAQEIAGIQRRRADLAESTLQAERGQRIDQAAERVACAVNRFQLARRVQAAEGMDQIEQAARDMGASLLASGAIKVEVHEELPDLKFYLIANVIRPDAPMAGSVVVAGVLGA